MHYVNGDTHQMTVLVTGGAGFIGSAFVRHLVQDTDEVVVNVDALTYAGNLDSLAAVEDADKYVFELIDICDARSLEKVIAAHSPDCIAHLAAESHVDRSIDGPGQFVQTNIVGTYNLLQASLRHYRSLSPEARRRFRFLHVSTDEVFGDLGADDPRFNESTAYNPSSPYSATKAGSDHLVRAWNRTYGLPVIVTNCSNNYGPYQFPEKLIPHMILNALSGKPLPIYGNGCQVRDWLFVEDHARALRTVLGHGAVGETYTIGGDNEHRNIDVVRKICSILEELAPSRPAKAAYESLITHVTDRPGHDTRYAIDATKIERELGWKPAESFDSGLRKTIEWYLANEPWWQRVLSGDYRLERIGEAGAA